MDDPWRITIIFSFGWALGWTVLAILKVLIPITVRHWRSRK